jgi:hypothetical protein
VRTLAATTIKKRRELLEGKLLPFWAHKGLRQLRDLNLALRQQLPAMKRTTRRPRLQTGDRLFWIALARLWRNWRTALVLGAAARVGPISLRATDPAVVSKILYLRQTYFGPGKIADYLKRFHAVTVARSSVHRILGRRGMNRVSANQKHQSHRNCWQRYEKPLPGHQLQLDVKFLERIPRLAEAALSIHRDRRWHADSHPQGVRRV